METKLERFNVLKQKMTDLGSYTKLPPEEQKEYSVLKKELKEVEKTNESKPSENIGDPGNYIPNEKPIDVPQNDSVVLTRSEYEKLINMANVVDSLVSTQKGLEDKLGITTLNEWSAVKEEEKRAHKATLRKFRATTNDEWEYVVDLRHIKFDFNPETRRYNLDIYEVTLLKVNADGSPSSRKLEMPIDQFLKIQDFEEVKIIKTVETPQQLIQGKTLRSIVDDDGYTIPGKKTSEVVPLIVKRKEYKCTVELPSGRQLDINANRLNL